MTWLEVALLCARYVVPNGFFATPIKMIAIIAVVSKAAGSRAVPWTTFSTKVPNQPR